MFQNTLFTSSKNEEISGVKNVAQILDNIKDKIENKEITPQKTAIFFDLDLTVFDREGIMSDLNAGQRRAFIESLNKIDPSLTELLYAQAPYHLIEDQIMDVLKQLQEEGFIVLGFTSRRTGKAKMDSLTTVEEDACKMLAELGVSFSSIDDCEFNIPAESIQLENPNLLPYEIVGNPKLFGSSSGVATVFTANYPKGLILEQVREYLNSQQKEIEHIIVVDDNASYLKNLRDNSQKNKLAFTGLHYTYAHDNKKLLDEDILAVQKECLIDERKFITEDEAKTKLESKISLTNG